MPAATYAPLTANDIPAAQAVKPDTSLNSLQEDAAGNLMVDEAPSAAPYAVGFATVTAAFRLAAHACRRLMITAAKANTKAVLIGLDVDGTSGSVAWHNEVLAGGAIVLPWPDTSKVWVKSEDGTTSVSYSVVAE